MEYLLQQVLNGLTIGSVYALIAIGYTMVYGIIGMINFAHGEVYMIGAFIGVIVIVALSAVGLSFVPVAILAALILSVVFTAVIGWTIERIAYRPLRNAPRLAPLISAIGMSIFLQNFVLWMQGARVKALPDLLGGRHILAQRADGFSVAISNSQIVIIAATFVVMSVFAYLVMRTPLGRAQRACAQDKVMAGYLGVNVDRTISSTFVIGAGLAAVAGILVTLLYGVVDFNIGFVAGIKAFTAAVLGGIGSIPGAVVGGILLGLIEGLWSSYVSSSYKDAAAFTVLVLVLLIKPTGLFGRPEIEKV